MTTLWSQSHFAIAGAEECPVGADSIHLILLQDPQVRRVLDPVPCTRYSARTLSPFGLTCCLTALARHRPYRSRRRAAAWAGQWVMARLEKGWHWPQRCAQRTGVRLSCYGSWRTSVPTACHDDASMLSSVRFIGAKRPSLQGGYQLPTQGTTEMRRNSRL